MTVRRLLSGLFPGKPDSPPPPFLVALPHLPGPVCVVGDIHGRLDLLDRLLALIAAQAGAPRLIFAGDYIDRGPDSAAVLARLRGLDAVCLLGNHERMLLEVLDSPATAGMRWLRNGGDATLASFGITGRLPGQGAEARMAALADALRQAMPPGLEDWLRALPLFWQDQGLAVVHAGADPALPLAEQTEDALIWGHRDFRKRRPDGLWIVHGHVIVAEPTAEAGRIAVDTGAWATGHLTAAWIEAGGVRFLQS